MKPISIYGDKFDLLSDQYQDKFRPGAYHDGVSESEETYTLARMIQNHLFLTQTKEGQRIFASILKKYTHRSVKKIVPIEVFLSRENTYPNIYFDIKDDINAPYRLYDYPDIHSGDIQQGRISKINSLRPNLVVSLHLTGGKKNQVGALNAVITPGYNTFKMAIDYVKNPKQRRKIRKKFHKSAYSNWFQSKNRNHFESFLLDSWIYFTGFWCEKNGLRPLQEKFRGYRHNMIRWRYQDKQGWHLKAKKHPRWSPYSKQLRYTSLRGAFWRREKSSPESWRRENGPEGYGGDNLYASHELLRYLRKGLMVNNVEDEDTLPQILEPYLSTWSVPTYINAISAYLELGYLDIKKDYNRLLKHKKIYAEAIAVGIYSLFFSLTQNKKSRDHNLPWGEAINLKKYEQYQGRNYFQEAF